MKKIIAFSGSPRQNSNSTIMLQSFLNGTEATVDVIHTEKINLNFCSGCLRCNILGRCAQRDDAWQELSSEILSADVLAFASPIYFHHISASLKKLIDRFRSFIRVHITESGLIHTPVSSWSKDFVLLLSMGSPLESEAQPVIDLFNFMTKMLGDQNNLHILCGTRLAVSGQITKSEIELEALYKRMNIPVHLAGKDFINNRELMNRCFELGKELK